MRAFNIFTNELLSLSLNHNLVVCFTAHYVRETTANNRMYACNHLKPCDNNHKTQPILALHKTHASCVRASKATNAVARSALYIMSPLTAYQCILRATAHVQQHRYKCTQSCSRSLCVHAHVRGLHVPAWLCPEKAASNKIPYARDVCECVIGWQDLGPRILTVQHCNHAEGQARERRELHCIDV